MPWVRALGERLAEFYLEGPPREHNGLAGLGARLLQCRRARTVNRRSRGRGATPLPRVVQRYENVAAERELPCPVFRPAYLEAPAFDVRAPRPQAEILVARCRAVLLSIYGGANSQDQ